MKDAMPQQRSAPPARSTGLSVLAVAVLLMTAGCATSTVYTPPALQQPAAWNNAPAATQTASAQPADAKTSAGALTPWWADFGDARLTQLIEAALAHNNNLAQAAIKVRRAQLQANQAEADRWPSVAVQGSSSASRALKGGAGVQRSYSATASVSWEADLWGRLDALKRASDWEVAATVEDRDATAQSLVATTAKLYWQVAYLNQRIQASEQSIDYARQTLRIVEAQFRAGSATSLDVAQARQTLAAQEASHHDWLEQRVEERNALAILFDRPPGAVGDELQALPDGALPEVPAGLPADLLMRRPDLRAAELRLREALAEVDATRTSYYPTFTLTGNAGGSSTALSKMLSDPIGTLGAGLTLPFVQWRTMQRAVAISQSDYDTATLSYRQAWYQALADVENALSNRQQLEAQGAKLLEAAQAAHQAEKLAEIRYRSGAVALKVWLDAQETRRTADNNLAASRLNRLNALATLYEVLGGPASAPATAGG
jgi:NodT family efflux transporter outer membrane factor (OMF) lipoprotein